MVDGLGFDPQRNQYFTVTYAWKYLVPNQKKTKTIIGKSGITKYDVKVAMSEAAPTRGKQFHQEALWGYECDRKYLPNDTTEEQANRIVLAMDNLFKESMATMDWTLRDKKQSKEIGTEFYEGSNDIWLDTIKNEWADAFFSAIKTVLGFDYNFDISQVPAMGSQSNVTEQIGESLNYNNKVRSIIPCGYGKGFVMWYGVHNWEQFKDKKYIVYYCHNIPATKQLSVKHSGYAGGNDGYKRVVVCSEKKYVNGQTKYGIENFMASESKLEEFIDSSKRSSQKVIFYVNNKSAGEFLNKFKEDYVSIVDESQEFTGNKDNDKCDAIVKSRSKYQVSFTATEIRRGTDTNRDKIYNDDVEYFGTIATQITVSQTIFEGRSCPIHFKTVEVSENNILFREINNNNILETIFDQEDDSKNLSIRGRMLRAAVCLVKAIKEDNRTHPLVVTSHIKDTLSFIRLVDKLKEYGIVPKEYTIVRGLREDGLKSANTFNEYNKSILVGTPWLITGIDAPNTDSFIPVYDMGSEITATQGIGRGQRPVEDKNLIVYIPNNPNDREISTMLRVANKFINDENIHIEAEESNITEEYTVLGSVQRRNITSEIDRDINANPVLKVYWDKVYEDLSSDTIGMAGDYSIFVDFNEAKKYMWGIGIKHSVEFVDWVKLGNKPSFIPSDPYRFYLNKGWLSWPDFLGTNPGWVSKFNEENEEFLKDYFNPQHIGYGEIYRCVDDLVDILKIGPNTIMRKCKELGIDCPGLYGKNKDSYNIKYGTPEMCRDWLWNMGFDRGYDDPKYKQYIKNGGEIPKWFRTFAYVGEGKVNTRFYNKRLQHQDESIIKIGELYSKGYSYSMLSKELGIPKATIATLVKKHTFKSDVDFETKKNLTHKSTGSKKGRPIKKIDLIHFEKHINKHKCRTTRDFKKSGYSFSLETIKRQYPDFKWDNYKFKN